MLRSIGQGVEEANNETPRRTRQRKGDDEDMQRMTWSRGDLLSLLDRACPRVGVEESATDPLSPGMLRVDAIALLELIARRTTGMTLSAFLAWRTERTAQEHRARQRKRETERARQHAEAL